MHLLARFLPAPPSRRIARSIAPQALESLEHRLYLTPWSGDWQYGPPPDAPPPFMDHGPYDMHICDTCLETIEVPDEGNIPIKVKIKGDTLKASGKSGDLRCKLLLTATQHNTLAIGDVTQATGTVTFKLPGPNGKKITVKLDVINATRVP